MFELNYVLVHTTVELLAVVSSFFVHYITLGMFRGFAILSSIYKELHLNNDNEFLKFLKY